MPTRPRLAAALLAALALPAAARAQGPMPSSPAVRAVPAPSVPAAPYVPRSAPTPAPAAPAPAPAATANKRLDVNSAAAAQLGTLPGVGPARCAAIIAGRPYADLNELVTKKALPQSVLNAIKDRLALANINTASAADMERTLKGIGDVRAKAIVAGRPYAAPQELVTRKVLTQGVFDGVKDLITY